MQVTNPARALTFWRLKMDKKDLLLVLGFVVSVFLVILFIYFFVWDFEAQKPDLNIIKTSGIACWVCLVWSAFFDNLFYK
jgi:hypothetical protein